MAKKQFKTESKKLLDMMINSIYTHKEIFLRELLSNASDAIDKLYYRSLTDGDVGLSKESFEIKLSADKDSRTIVIEDNGIGMTRDELENNLGTIAKSGSFDFKNDNEKKRGCGYNRSVRRRILLGFHGKRQYQRCQPCIRQ